MNCTLCGVSIAEGSTMCPCCGAPYDAPKQSEQAEDVLDQCLPVGTSLLGGHYRVGRILGHGGFGVTYQGSDLPMQLPVAIKEFFPSGCFRRGTGLQHGRRNSSQAFAEQRARFLEEARLLARLNHPGIVRVYTAFEENNTAYMAMEYLGGQTLEARIHERGRLSEDEVLVIIRMLAEALEVVHGRGDGGILHRDIKPSNIMLTPELRVVLIDFGAARQFAANVSRAMSQVLTPGYAPLEQYSARARFGPPVDIYALGATIWHALTGEAPPEAVERSQGVELKAPHQVCPSVSQRTSDAVMAAMEMVASHRPQSVADLLGMLRNGSSSPQAIPRVVPTRPQGTTHQVVNPSSRLPASPKVPAPPSTPLLAGQVRPLAINAQGFQEFVNEKEGSVLVQTPGGTFQMGSNTDDEEKPIHPVTLPSFLVSRVPVTNAQFARFVSAAGYDAGSEWREYASKWGDQAPVVCVNWNDASAYCTWAGLRLPTEAEWEYAARGPQSWVYPWGDVWEPSRCQNSVGSNAPGRAARVGSFPSGASPLGCLDMAGNVWEWTSSWYGRYPGNNTANQQSGQAYRVLRGGSWDCDAPSVFRGAFRSRCDPGSRNDYSGFRCARTH